MTRQDIVIPSNRRGDSRIAHKSDYEDATATVKGNDVCDLLLLGEG